MSKFYDDRCANCGHPSEAHHAGDGKCYVCDAKARCFQFEKRSMVPVKGPDPFAVKP